MADLTTIERLRSYLGAEYVTRDDELLRQLISAASSFFIQEVGRDIALTEYVDTVDGGGGSTLNLRASPVVEVTSVTVNGEIIPERSTWDSEGWSLRGDQVRLVGYQFSVGLDNVIVEYTAGWAEIPDDIQGAVCELAILKRNERDRIGVFSRSVPGQDTTSYQVISIPVGIQRVIDHYRLPVVG